MKTIVLLIFIVVIIFIFRNYIFKLNKKFYKVNEVFPELNNIYLDNLDKKIINEINNNININNMWINWPERPLYDSKNATWKIIPFYGFGIWVDENLKKFPQTAKFLKNIKGLKVAIISKLGPNTKLKEHRGWANLSNNVLRCHFGIKVPKNKCFISVGDIINEKTYNHNDDVDMSNVNWEIQFHENNKWTIFDDSKLHFAGNFSDQERIVLILDIERPYFVKKGNAIKGDTKELTELIEQFKDKTKN